MFMQRSISLFLFCSSVYLHAEEHWKYPQDYKHSNTLREEIRKSVTREGLTFLRKIQQALASTDVHYQQRARDPSSPAENGRPPGQGIFIGAKVTAAVCHCC